MRKAFTLVELLVVVGILGVLMAVLVGNFFGGRESARAARCLANMKNLGNACQSYGATEDRYPRAGSCEMITIKRAGSSRTDHAYYSECPGWISWDSRGNYPGGSRKSSANNPLVGLYSTDQDAVKHALTNGTVWAYVARNEQNYVCPSHAKAMSGTTPPHWSYLMSNMFYGNVDKVQRSRGGIGYQNLPRADRYLLFSEVPFMKYSSWNPSGSGASTATDAVLQYKNGETIGANHVNGKNLYAHVCFADGHTEKIKIPYTGTPDHPKADEQQLKSLTTWLCEGTDFTYNGSRYEKIN